MFIKNRIFVLLGVLVLLWQEYLATKTQKHKNLTKSKRSKSDL